MSTTTDTTIRLPKGTKMKWLSGDPVADEMNTAFDTTVPPILQVDDGSPTLRYFCLVTDRNGRSSTTWLYASQVEEDLDAFPEPPEHVWSDSDRAVLANLRWWCEVAQDEVKDSVDEQATFLRDGYSLGDGTRWADRPEPVYVLWFGSPWGTTGEGKDYLGKVMRRARKVRTERVQSLDGAPTSAPTSDAPESDRVRELQAQVESLTREEQRLREDAAVARRHHREDIALIGERLLAEAANRDWCSEYDDVVEALNRSLYVELPIRETEYTVTWTETYTVTVDRCSTYTARNGDDAEELARESEDCKHEILRALERAGLNVDVSYESQDNFEAEESN